MQHPTNLVPPVPTLPRIDAKQDIALTAILAGATDGEAAAKARVRRETVHRWRHNDPHFIAELARRRGEVWLSHVEQLRGLFAKAIGALSDALDAQSPPVVRLKAAAVVLRAVGMAEQSLQPPHAPSSPTAVLRSWAEAEREREKDEEWKAMMERCGIGRP